MSKAGGSCPLFRIMFHAIGNVDERREEEGDITPGDLKPHPA
jgi:hypothetical protein